MKKEEIRTNCVVWSKRFKCFGQAIGQKDFMVLVIFVKYPRVWLHCSEVCLDPMKEDETWTKK